MCGVYIGYSTTMVGEDTRHSNGRRVPAGALSPDVAAQRRPGWFHLCRRGNTPVQTLAESPGGSKSQHTNTATVYRKIWKS